MHWLLFHSTPPGRRWRNNVLTWWPIPEETGTAESVEALHRLMRDFKGLRTRYPIDASSIPVQQVLADFHPPVALCDVAGAVDERAAAEAFVGRALQQDFDLAAGPPISAVLVTSGAQARWMALIIHHISIDGAARRTLASSFERHLAAIRHGGPATAPHSGSPLNDAVLQGSAAGRQLSDAAIRRWAGVAAAMPPTTLPVPVLSADGPLPTEAILTTDRAAVCERVARRSGVPVSTAFLGAYSAVLGRFLRMDRTPINVYSSNRFDADHAESVGCLYQTLPVLVGNDGKDSIRALMKQAQTALLDTYRFGCYDYDDATDTRVREQFRLGRNVSVMPSFNFPPAGSAAADRGSAPAGWSVTPIEHDLGDPFEFVVQIMGPDVLCAVRFDAALIPPATATGLISAVLRVLDIADEHPDLPVGLLLDAAGTPVLDRGADWTRRDGSWIHLDGIAEAARSHPAVTGATVATGSDGSLTLRVEADASLTPYALRCHLTGRLAELPGTVVPETFVLNGAPDDGREPGDGVFGSVREVAFELALRHVRPGAAWNAAQPYLLQGGRTADLSRVLAELATAGLGGLTYVDLMDFRPLADLARDARVVLPADMPAPLGDSRRLPVPAPAELI
ncbi:hypothetical protein J3R03_008348 [Actinoplanes couchii]|nr:hypothetical protein [Actinoplanes couchii]